MNAYRSHLVLSVLIAVGAFGATACDDGGTDPMAAGGSGGAAGVAGAPSGGSTGKAAGVTVKPDATGWVDAKADGNTIGVQGAWYPYGDSYGDQKCIVAGMHPAADCSTIASPDPSLKAFANVDGKMCTKGSVAKILSGTNGMPDYSNMWGAGIGVDLNSSGGDMAVKMTFDAMAKGITGIGFNVTFTTKAPLRVELPIPATEGHMDGSDYWGATSSFPPSPVMPGWNEFKWADVKGPKMAIPFDPTKMLAVQFHVPANTTARTEFEYCISDLTFLTQ